MEVVSLLSRGAGVVDWTLVTVVVVGPCGFFWVVVVVFVAAGVVGLVCVVTVVVVAVVVSPVHRAPSSLYRH